MLRSLALAFAATAAAAAETVRETKWVYIYRRCRRAPSAKRAVEMLSAVSALGGSALGGSEGSWPPILVGFDMGAVRQFRKGWRKE